MSSESDSMNSPDETSAPAGTDASLSAGAPESNPREDVDPSAVHENGPFGEPHTVDTPISEEQIEATTPATGADDTEVETEEVEPEETGPVKPLMDISEEVEAIDFRWYILKVQVNREDSIRDALARKVKVEGLDKYFGEIVVPTEDVAEYTKSGKRRIVKRKLYPGYIVVHMAVNDDTWFLVRDTAGIGDFTGSVGRPAPLPDHEVEKLLRISKPAEDTKGSIRTAIPFKHGDRVRVKDGHFQNFEGDVETVDEANGRVTVMINIFGRSTPVELEHWQIEAV